jgi:hypothetical protein
MAQIDRIVQVYITRQTAQVSMASFDIPLILVEINTDTIQFPERVRTYTDLSEVADDFGTTHPAYLMAVKLLGGDIRPAQFKIGKVATNSTATETYPVALQAVLEADDTWYALLAANHADAVIEALAEVIQANRKMYFTSTSSAKAIDALETTDIGNVLKAAGYDRTVVMYSATADSDFPEAAWVGTQINEVPGSNSWEYKKLAGVTVSNLRSTNITVLEQKGYNYYIQVKGANITRKGVTAQGEWIDTMIFIDWLHARLQEQIFFRLINRKKIPYTRTGATIIENEIRSVLSQGVNNGGIADDTPVVVRSPDPLNIPEVVRATRVMGDFQFEVRLAGAISSVIVRGTVGY